MYCQRMCNLLVKKINRREIFERFLRDFSHRNHFSSINCTLTVQIELRGRQGSYQGIRFDCVHLESHCHDLAGKKLGSVPYGIPYFYHFHLYSISDHFS